MSKFFDFLFLLLRQVGGGPGPPENNLVRFGLAAILWSILLKIAWSRQRSQELPREKLLVWGFGLALLHEINMFSMTSLKIITNNHSEQICSVIEPIEHGLAMLAIIVTAGAFLRYLLDDNAIPRSYIQVGGGIVALSLLYASFSWPRQLAVAPDFRFHQTWTSLLFHLPLSIMLVVAIFLLRSKPGWLRNIVSTALGFYFLSEFLFILNFSTQRVYASIFCPIGNNFHLCAIALLGYVYIREQSSEKERAEAALKAYRDQLEELVTARTAELTAVNASFNKQLQLAAVLEERQRIAANMHDGLSQTLGLLGLQVDRTTELVTDGRNHEAIHSIEEIRRVVAHAFTEVRSSIASLTESPRTLPSLQASLRDIAAQFTKNDGAALDFEDGTSADLFLSNEISTQVFSIVKESLLNIRRHANASQIRLVLETVDEEVWLFIEDDGCGFDLNATRGEEGHFGLSIMQARATRISGKLAIDSVPGYGTRISLCWLNQAYKYPVYQSASREFAGTG